MSYQVYKKLPDDLKLAVDTAARKAVLWERYVNNKENEEYVAKLGEVMKVNTLSKESQAEFRKIGLQGYEGFAKSLGKNGAELVRLFAWASE